MYAFVGTRFDSQLGTLSKVEMERRNCGDYCRRTE
jgi:hypothetical protein